MRVDETGLVITSKLEDALAVAMYWTPKKSKLHYKTLMKIRWQLL